MTTSHARFRALASGGLSGASVAVVIVFACAQGCTTSSGPTTAVVTCGDGTEQSGSFCTVSLDASTLCGPGTTFSGGSCVPVEAVDATADAPADATADATTVSCGAGTVLSGNSCVPAPDAGASCGPGTILSGGVCVPVPAEAGTDAQTCGAGTHECAGECYANDDGAHCGAACTACASSTPACVSGACACTYTSCPAGEACVSGACVAAACTGSANCTNGMCCSGTCMPGATCCVASDCPSVNSCQTAVACTAGQCVYTPVSDGTSCSNGTCCGGTCDNLQSDKFNCGACGAACYGGAVTALCNAGHCAQLVAQAVNSGNAVNAGSGGPGNLGTPTLAIDANNVYFLAPSNGQILQSPLSNLGNTNPQVLVTNNGSGTLVSIAMLTIDASNVYYAPLPPGFLGAGQTLANSIPIGGGTKATFLGNFTNQVVGNVSLVVDSTNLYMSLYETIGVAAKTGGTFTALTPDIDNGNYAYGNLLDDGTYLYWVVSNSSYNLARYDLATANLAYLATGFTETTVLALGGSNVFWATSNSVMAAPTSGATPAVTWASVNPWIGYMGADPATGDVYWINSNGPGGGEGTLYKMTTPGQTPVVIMPGQNWGTPVFDASNVYYMNGYNNYVQVWRSPK